MSAQDTEAIRAALDYGSDEDRPVGYMPAQNVRDEAKRALDRLVARLEAAERERDGYREALGIVAGWDAVYAKAHGNIGVREFARAALAAAAPGETTPTCICTRFRDLPAGTIIADLTCPVHGVNGTDPGDVLP